MKLLYPLDISFRCLKFYIYDVNNKLRLYDISAILHVV